MLRRRASRIRAIAIVPFLWIALGAIPVHPAQSATGSLAGTGPLGAGLWTDRYDGPLDSLDLPQDIAVSPDGSEVVVTGTVDYSSDFLTIAYDAATGARRWISRYDGPGHGFDWATGVVVTPDGSTVMVTGYGDGGYALNYQTVAYDAITGKQRWVAAYDGGFHKDDEAYGIAVTPDGAAVVVTGSSSRGNTNDFATVAYEVATGAQLWVARYSGPVDGAGARAIAISPDGARVLVTGESQGDGTGTDFATIAYDPGTGEELWVARYNRQMASLETDPVVAVSPDGSTVAVVGQSWVGSFSDSATVAYDAATGSQRWADIYSGPEGKRDVGDAVGFTTDGSTILIAGYSFTDPYLQMLTIAYDAPTGGRRWISIYESPGAGGSGAYALAVTPDGGMVIVAGWGYGNQTLADFTAVEYEVATGKQLHVARAGRQSSDAVKAIVLSPDGSRVFMTGSVGQGEGLTDFGTIAYAS